MPSHAPLARRALLVATTVATLAALAPFGARAQNALDEAVARKLIRIAIPTDFPPYGFVGTDLEQQLRGAGIGWLAVCGLTTECCVAATATDAFQREWPVLLPQDAVAAYDPDVHHAALEQLALNVAVLTDSTELAGLFEETTR